MRHLASGQNIVKTRGVYKMAYPGVVMLLHIAALENSFIIMNVEEDSWWNFIGPTDSSNIFSCSAQPMSSSFPAYFKGHLYYREGKSAFLLLGTLIHFPKRKQRVFNPVPPFWAAFLSQLTVLKAPPRISNLVVKSLNISINFRFSP